MAHELESIPLSNNRVGRRIHEIASDILIQLMERVKNVNYALQLDESTDISSSSKLLAFIRYSFKGKLNEDMLFCLALEGKCTGDNIFMALDKKLHELGLSWDRCVGICTDGAGAILGKKKGLKAKVHNVAPHIRFTHCVIHREALACKAIVPELKTVFDTAVKIVNYIKSRPLNARLFASLCKDMGSDHEALLLHTEIRWLSRGKVFTRLYQLRDEVRLFPLDSSSEFSVFMTDSNWLGKLVYLSCIIDKLNELNLSIQVPNTNIFSLFDKINAFSKKLEQWISRGEEGNIEMFPELEEFGEENELCLDNLKAIIVNHLRNLLNHFKKYFFRRVRSRTV
ncbi:zinc finger BED domain-containing protein 5-like [Macrobrachium rosenbergii]|uniref:zinc finger BED domain-containing protein 5-like n=1 Tax=Macrobrachium rosenbergii TaxID=79674 RepID=UPI0034D6F887